MTKKKYPPYFFDAPHGLGGVGGVRGCRIHSSEKTFFILQTSYLFYPPYTPQFLLKPLKYRSALVGGVRKNRTPFVEFYTPLPPLPINW